MREHELPISEIVSRIPAPAELRARLTKNLQERILIRKLLRLAEQQASRAEREVGND